MNDPQYALAQLKLAQAERVIAELQSTIGAQAGTLAQNKIVIADLTAHATALEQANAALAERVRAQDEKLKQGGADAPAGESVDAAPVH